MKKIISSSVILIFLLACRLSSTPTSPPPLTATPTPTPVIPPACSPTYNADYEAQVITLINNERVKNNLAPLSANTDLGYAARNHSIDMACTGSYSHDDANGNFYPLIAKGFCTPESVTQAWISDAQHREVILWDVAEIGVGYASTGNSSCLYSVIFSLSKK